MIQCYNKNRHLHFIVFSIYAVYNYQPLTTYNYNALK